MNEATTTRQEHLDWCKQRARQYLKYGNHREAWTSMASDMSKHPETRNHPALKLGMELLLAGLNDNVEEMTRFIEGFN